MQTTFAVEVNKLTKIFGKETRAVDEISFKVDEGQIYGFLGPNGAGKTTTLRMLQTLIKPTSGTIRIFGMDSRRSQSGIRLITGNVPQEISADGDLTGYENLLIFAKLYYVKDRKERKARIEQALEYMGLTEKADDLVKHYSGGMMRRLEIAQALVNRPKLLFLDEPSIGLDPGVRREVWKHIKDLNQELGITVMLTTHDMGEAEELCENIGILNAGRIVAEGSPAELKKSVGGDLIKIKTAPTRANVVSQEQGRLKLDDSVGVVMSESDSETVIVPAVRGEEAIPKILAEYEKASIPVQSISLSRPTLDDVFLKYAKVRMGDIESVREARLARRSFRRHAR